MDLEIDLINDYSGLKEKSFSEIEAALFISIYPVPVFYVHAIKRK